MTPNTQQKVQPIYRQVARQIARDIKNGTLPPEARIPSERELAEQFNISRMTARAAINLLVRRGLIVRHTGARAYVAPPKIRLDLSSADGLYKQLHHAGIKPGARIITVEKQLCSQFDAKICTALKLEPQESIYHIVRLRTANDEPIAVEDSYFPVKLFPNLLDFHLTDSIYGILKKYFDFEPAQSTQTLEFSLLDAEWAEIMGVPVDLPTLDIRRRAFSAEGIPFEFAHDIYRGDRIIFTARTTPANEDNVSTSGWTQALDNLQHNIT